MLLATGRSKDEKTVEWTSKDLLKGLEEFVPIYETRPIKDYGFGMGFDHGFGLWFMARWLKPDLMIDSGVFKGHSSWFLQQAMPETPIIILSPYHPEKSCVDQNCRFIARADFVDFGNADWKTIILTLYGTLDFSRVLVFFHDHQSHLKR